MNEDKRSLSVGIGRQILEELQELRRDVASALAGIREAVDELHRIERTETIIESELDEVTERLGPPPSETNCASCGSLLERHLAQSGLLLICKACGRSSFLDRRHGAERRQGASPQPLEGAPAQQISVSSDGWTGK